MVAIPNSATGGSLTYRNGTGVHTAVGDVMAMSNAEYLAAKNMTAGEWVKTTNMTILSVSLMIHHPMSDRKKRLFECACCRRVWEQLPDPRSRRAIEVAEQFADGLVAEIELDAASEAAHKVWESDRPIAFDVTADGEERDRDFWPLPFSAAAYNVAIQMGHWGGAPAFDWPSKILRRAVPDPVTEAAAQAALLRCIFGNPFRPVAFDPRWRSETAVALARGIYENRAFDRMPILADALEEAGCDHPDVLTHCRSDGPHARGCWVVDQVLGKE